MRKVRSAREGERGLHYIMAILFGAIIGAALCALLLFIAARVIASTGHIPQNSLSMITLFIAILGSFISGIFSAKIAGARGLMVGLLSALVLFLLFLICSAFLSKAAFSVESGTKLAAMLLSGAIGGLIVANRHARK